MRKTEAKSDGGTDLSHTASGAGPEFQPKLAGPKCRWLTPVGKVTFPCIEMDFFGRISGRLRSGRCCRILVPFLAARIARCSLWGSIYTCQFFNSLLSTLIQRRGHRVLWKVFLLGRTNHPWAWCPREMDRKGSRKGEKGKEGAQAPMGQGRESHQLRRPQWN
jgi:hypothetical protein